MSQDKGWSFWSMTVIQQTCQSKRINYNSLSLDYSWAWITSKYKAQTENKEINNAIFT